MGSTVKSLFNVSLRGSGFYHSNEDNLILRKKYDIEIKKETLNGGFAVICFLQHTLNFFWHFPILNI